MVSGAIHTTVVDLDQGNSRAQLTMTRTLEINRPVHEPGSSLLSCGHCRWHADLLAGVNWRPVAEHREEDPGKFSCQRRVATAFLRRNSIRSAHIRNPRVSGTLL